MELDGKVALVTGASRGVGAATAVALAEAGCLVACAARSTQDAPQRTAGTLDETLRRVQAVGGTALAVPTNLADRDEVRAMVARTVEHFGGVDIVINNAAVQFIGDLQQPEHRHELTFAVNYWAPYIAIQAAYPHMAQRTGGAIINVSSLAALLPIPHMLSYGASKIALEHLTLDAARALSPHGIAVNCFRIDVAVASEGFVANTPGVDRSDWEPCEVPAEGIVWMLRQPMEYTGRRESMYHLRKREGIMKTRAARPVDRGPTPTELFDGLYGAATSGLAEPYE
ncbi:MAG: SDR family NAD(P)-dependent oxidoreductase [Acidimicrobiaceae bacterium]|nr:SDR family NAD(P)-dependent oxidoreductase [Acidimicrobiaceae bacterium]